MDKSKELSKEQKATLLEILKFRFEKNISRHEGFKWTDIVKKLDANPDKFWSLNEMEETGGEPDVIGFDENTNEYLFCDCSAESPNGRRSLCYDRKALEARKQYKPNNNAIDMAVSMGIEILNEEQYKYLQTLGEFDSKTSSWLKTPADIRNLGGAIFADFRYRKVFIYHNGAESYYAARGFRGILKV